MKESIEDKAKYVIEMYVVARQFKNAVDISEMLIIPSTKNNLANETKLNMGGLITVTVRGDKMISKFFPFIVNKAFACEVLLKILLTISDEKIPIGRDGHDLFKLYMAANKDNNLYTKIALSISDITPKKMNLEIEKTSNVFVDWRYIYEKSDKAKEVNFGFLNWFCEELDKIVIDVINTKYSYDVKKDFR